MKVPGCRPGRAAEAVTPVGVSSGAAPGASGNPAPPGSRAAVRAEPGWERGPRLRRLPARRFWWGSPGVGVGLAEGARGCPLTFCPRGSHRGDAWPGGRGLQRGPCSRGQTPCVPAGTRTSGLGLGAAGVPSPAFLMTSGLVVLARASSGLGCEAPEATASGLQASGTRCRVCRPLRWRRPPRGSGSGHVCLGSRGGRGQSPWPSPEPPGRAPGGGCHRSEP